MTGFIPVKRNSNTPYAGSVGRYYFAGGSALYVGQPVAVSAAADTAGKYLTVVAGTLAANNQWVGVVTAIQPVSTELATSTPLVTTYAPNGTACYVLVANDPDQEFLIGEDQASAAIVTGDVGNLGIAVTATSSTIYGTWGGVLDSSSFVSGTANGQVLLLGMEDRPDFALGGTSPVPLFRVKINEAMHQLATPGTTV